MSWEILNANNIRWGSETYPTREAAQEELRKFWRGVHGVNLKKFTIKEVASTLPSTHGNSIESIEGGAS
jgi:hypothetical protein